MTNSASKVSKRRTGTVKPSGATKKETGKQLKKIKSVKPHRAEKE